jgi:hypothetical protein
MSDARRAPSTAAPAHVLLRVQCGSCLGAVDLECEGLQGFWGYETHNEYFCPHCRKQNHHRTTGSIVSARVPMDAM